VEEKRENSSQKKFTVTEKNTQRGKTGKPATMDARKDNQSGPGEKKVGSKKKKKPPKFPVLFRVTVGWHLPLGDTNKNPSPINKKKNRQGKPAGGPEKKNQGGTKNVTRARGTPFLDQKKPCSSGGKVGFSSKDARKGLSTETCRSQFVEGG